MKKIIALVMSLVLIFSLGTVAFAFGSKSVCDPCSTPCVDSCDKTKDAIAFTTDVVTNLAKGAANAAALITAKKADHVSDIVDAAVTAGASLVTDCKTGKAVGDADPVTTTSSPKTFDAGIALYVGLAVMGATGSAFVIGKKKDF